MISLLIFAIAVVLVCAVLCYVARLLVTTQPFQNIVIALIILIGLLVVLAHAYPAFGTGLH